MSDTAEAIEAESETEQPAGLAAETPNEIAARRLGWRPRSEYSGPPEKFVEADEFVRRTDESVPLLRQNYRALHERFSQVERKLADTTQLLQEFRDFSAKGEQRAYERAKRELEERQRVAVSQADTEAFEKTAAEIAELEKSRPKPAPEPVEPQRKIPEPDPRITTWISDNPWYNSDGQLRAFAGAYDQYLMASAPGMDIGERLAAVKAKTMAEFPDKFGNSRREAPTNVASPAAASAPRRKGNGRSYDDLPPDAKKQCDKLVAQFKGSKTPYTREEYCRDFDWEG